MLASLLKFFQPQVDCQGAGDYNFSFGFHFFNPLIPRHIYIALINNNGYISVAIHRDAHIILFPMVNHQPSRFLFVSNKTPIQLETTTHHIIISVVFTPPPTVSAFNVPPVS
jgi:hypothetical protein